MTAINKDRHNALEKLRETITKNLPKGFEEQITSNMLSYVVPHSIYPKGYHCNPKQPLPFINISSTKKHIALNHLGLYSDPTLADWFENEYQKKADHKLDMGKGCIRFKKMESIPFALVGELMKKMSPWDWIDLYEKR